MSVPQLRLYKDDNLTQVQLDRLNELWNFFKDDNPKWLLRQECLNMKSVENFIFVFACFEGAAFEHLKLLKARIISAHCMLNSLKTKKKLPRSSMPVYSHAMLDLNICCTNVEKKQREEIYEKVEMMRGKTNKIFTEKVTHLITTEVGSAKYHAAASMKIPIMLPEWVNKIWQLSEEEEVEITNSKFDQYKCPIFYNYVITASGFSESVKNDIKKSIESQGGKYRGEMVCGVTTHLITNDAKGMKYDHAKVWKIHICKEDWIHDSIKFGYCLPENKYVLENGTQTSTPTDKLGMQASKIKSRLEMIDVSVISGPGQNQIIKNIKDSKVNNSNQTKLVNETDFNSTNFPAKNSFLFSQSINNNANGSFNNTTLVSNNQFQKTANTNGSFLNKPNLISSASNYSDILKELNNLGKTKWDLFDGINIYYENFDSAINEKLRKQFNASGVIRFDEYNSEVTHVIVNQVNEKQCKSYLEMNPEVNILSIDWFINSCKENQVLDCKRFCVFKNALNSVKTPKKRARPEQSNLNATNIKSFDSDMDCLSQYLQVEAALVKPKETETNNDKFNIKNNINKACKQSLYEKQDKSVNQEASPNRNEKSSRFVEPQPFVKLNPIKGIFSNKFFQVIGFDELETEVNQKLLEENGANIIPYDPNLSDASFKRKFHVDFTLLPFTIPSPISNANPCTVYWLARCIAAKEIFDLKSDIFNQPIPKFNNDTPLSECVLTISGYPNHEKDLITNVCEMLGAKVQTSLSLKQAPNGILKNTHLICKLPIGPKWVAANSWKLPIVGVDWIIDCCVTGMKANEENFAIENTADRLNDLIENLDKIRVRKSNESQNSTLANTNTNSSRINFSKSIHHNNNDELSDSSLSMSISESKKPRLGASPSTNSSVNACQQNNANKNDDTDLGDNLVETEIKAPIIPPKFAPRASSYNQFQTPLNPRIKELKKRESFHTANSNNPNDSPVVFNNNNSNGTPINGQENRLSIENFRTPNTSIQSNDSFGSKKCETPLDVLFSNAIHIAYENVKKPGFFHENGAFQSPEINEYSFEKYAKVKKNYKEIIRNVEKYGLTYNDIYNDKKIQSDVRIDRYNNKNQHSDEEDIINPTPLDVKQKKQTLKNISVYVSKKLAKFQPELYNLVETLGGNFIWSLNESNKFSYTHFIYNGKLNDDNRELREALEMEKFIVTPDWLYACDEKGVRINEEFYKCESTGDINNYILQSESHANPTNFIVDDENKRFNNDHKKDECDHEMDSDKNDETEPVDDEEKGKENDFQEGTEREDPEKNPNYDNSHALPQIPDSMDIKARFLDELSEKLLQTAANNKSSSVNISGAKKWNKNLSNGNSFLNGTNEKSRSDSTMDNDNLMMDALNKYNEKAMLLNNRNDETCLSEAQALEELNKSKSKWGSTTSSKSSKKMLNNENENSTDDNLNKKNLKRANFSEKNMTGCKQVKLLNNSNHLNQLNNDDLQLSPSLINKNLKSSIQHSSFPPTSSQIQVTLWKEDTATTLTSKNQKIVNGNNNTNENTGTAIAERLISVSRCANISSKKN